MKKHYFFLLLLLSFSASSQVAINSNNDAPDNSAMLHVSSTTKGMLIPRMTSAQRTAIANAATGLLVFDINTNSFWFYNGSSWDALTSVNTGQWLTNGNNINNTNSGNVGIGTIAPSQKLDVNGGIKAADSVTINATNRLCALYVNGLDNTGTSAALKVQSGSQIMLIDGNEIDANSGLFLQNNTSANTIISNGGGNVGIGTNAPTEKLHVAGNITYTGDLDIGLQFLSGTSTVQPNTLAQMAKTCPAGTKLIGGGGGIETFGSGANAITINRSVPDEASNRWLVSVSNTGSSAKDCVVYAICAKVK